MVEIYYIQWSKLQNESLSMLIENIYIFLLSREDTV